MATIKRKSQDILGNNNLYKIGTTITIMEDEYVTPFLFEPNIFPRLENLINEFCTKNELPEPKSIVKTHGGTILNWDDNNLVLISIEYPSILAHSNLEPVWGSSERCTDKEVTYELSGILKKKTIKLETKISQTERYKLVEGGGYESTGEKNKYIFNF